MFPRAIKAITDAWVALEDEEDEEGEDELFAEEEEDEETDIESDGDAVEEVYELFYPIQSEKENSSNSRVIKANTGLGVQCQNKQCLGVLVS